MSMTKYLRIHYGPNESFHTFVHRPQKLNGLRDALRRLGYRVDVVPENVINCCIIEMAGFAIFQCNINNLIFNRPCKLDPVSQRAVSAVLAATRMMLRANHHYWAWMMLEDQVFKTIYFAHQIEWCSPYVNQENPVNQQVSHCKCYKDLDCSTQQVTDQRDSEQFDGDGSETNHYTF